MSDELLLIIISIAVVLFIALIYRILKKRKVSAEMQLTLILEEYRKDEISDFIIPDGIGGLLEIERLVLTDHGLLLIETYSMSGNLFGAEKIDLWTQIIDGRSYKFSNPLRHIRTSRQAIKALLPNLPIFCCVVFTSDSVFPKGKPEEVSVLKTLVEDLAYIKQTPKIATRSQAAWDRLIRIARKDGQAVMRSGDL